MKRLKGMQDFYPPNIHFMQKIEKMTAKCFSAYGFYEIRTPILEETTLFKRSVGEETDVVSKEMYHFTDQGGNDICLRPENTASVVRAYLENKFADKRPIHKLYYIGPMFRRERPQKGRYRQFHQVGAEIFGSAHPSSDAELLKMASELLANFGLKDLYTEINTIGCSKCRGEYRKSLKTFLTKQENLCSDCKSRRENNPLRVLDCKQKSCQTLLKTAPKPVDYVCEECSTHYSEFKHYLKLAGLEFVENPRLVRGLDYYTKTVFEIKSSSLGAQNTLCGGGRYDDLLKQFGGPDTPATGFSFGVERFILILQEAGILEEGFPKPTIFFAPLGENAKTLLYPVIFSLREEGVFVETDYAKNNLKKLMKMADKLGAAWTLILGDDEISKEKAILRNMQSKAQYELSLANLETDIVNHLQEKRGK